MRYGHALAALATAAIGATVPVRPAATADVLTGTWQLVAVDNVMPDGERIALYGPHPVGSLHFDDTGRYALQIYRPEAAPFASGDKARGTADEYRAATLRVNAHFGHYDLDARAGTITFHIEHASFPNWEGMTQVRHFTIDGDTLTYRVPTPTSGAGAIGEVVWVRASSRGSAPTHRRTRSATPT